MVSEAKAITAFPDSGRKPKAYEAPGLDLPSGKVKKEPAVF